jgi:ketosteroid isomerase-like protein
MKRVLRVLRVLAVLAMPGLLAVTFVGAQDEISPALRSLVDAERAFAETATQKGIRDSFLEYFAEDAIAFNPAPVSATARLRSRPARPFSEFELRWEPRTGDIAACGEFGWLSGPSTFIDHTDPDAKPQPGNYLSIWRRQGDGPWRVFIDVGSQPPQPVTFAPGFTRLTFASRYTRQESKDQAVAALLVADNTLNAQIGKAGSGAAYAEVTTSASRLHRNGFLPPIGTTAIRSWMNEHAATMTAATGAVDAARSGDLGYSYGIYDVKAVVPQHGAYVRVWQREASGTWLVVADVTQ